jgi:hypothetical protein
LLECGFVDGRGEGRERERLARLETDLQQAVRDINGNVIKLNPKN